MDYRVGGKDEFNDFVFKVAFIYRAGSIIENISISVNLNVSNGKRENIFQLRRGFGMT